MVSWEEMFEKAVTLMHMHGLADWKLRIENMRNPYRFANAEGGPLDAIGYCSHERKTIYIHTGCPDRHFRQTVLHEIAHALTPDDLQHGELAAQCGMSCRILISQ